MTQLKPSPLAEVLLDPAASSVKSAAGDGKPHPGVPEDCTFEEAIARLGRIVEHLERGDLPLETSLGLFEEGVRLARLSQERLDQADRRVEELLRVDSEGEPVTRKFDAKLRGRIGRYMIRTAAALIIGNELLSGKVQEANLAALAGSLRALGIELRRVVMVPDEIDVIAAEVRMLSAAHDVLFTSGGVGPTHDDVTIEAVAKAFDAKVTMSPHMESMLRAHYKERCTEGHLRMALIPDGAELVSSAEILWPTVVMRNVWVMPGIPEVFRMKLPLLRDRLAGAVPFVSRAVYTKMDEGELKPLLDSVVAAHKAVEVGSYPKWFDPAYKTKLTFDGRDAEAVSRAVDEFLALLPAGEPQRVE